MGCSPAQHLESTCQDGEDSQSLFSSAVNQMTRSPGEEVGTSHPRRVEGGVSGRTCQSEG